MRWLAIGLPIPLGLLVGAIVLLTTPYILGRTSNLTPGLRSEILTALPWLAASIPLVTIGGVLNGVLTAHERFGTINLIGMVGTVLFQLTPLWVAYHIGPELPAVIPAAVIARATPIILTALAAFRQISLSRARFNRTVLMTLIAYGGWVMVTNLIGPILISADQFVIATLLGAGAVAHYSIAYSLAVRLQIFPSALMQTMFPRLSQQTGPEALALAGQALKSIVLVMTTLCVPAIMLARLFISWWINPEFGSQAGPISEILLISVWINGIALIPFALLQAQGRPDIVAKFHFIEVVPFFVCLFAGIHFFGLIGAALAWTLRVLLDAFLLVRASRLSLTALGLLPIAGASLLIACAVAYIQPGGAIGVVGIAALSGGALAVWSIMVDPTLRTAARRASARLRRD
jgi:O-antigen/teichoic acid export membrane protein